MDRMGVCAMIAVIPLAGESKRFADAGYKMPKPFLSFSDGQMMIEKVLDTMPDEVKEIVLIARIENSMLMHGIKLNHPRAIYNKTFISGRRTLGPLDTLMVARKFMNKDRELLINYCDCWVGKPTMDSFIKESRASGKQASVVCFKSNDPRFHYEPSNTFAMSGIFWFKTGRKFIKEAMKYRDDPNTSPGHIAYTIPHWLGIQQCKTFVAEDYTDLGLPKTYELYKFMTSGKLMVKDEYQA